MEDTLKLNLEKVENGWVSTGKNKHYYGSIRAIQHWLNDGIYRVLSGREIDTMEVSITLKFEPGEKITK